MDLYEVKSKDDYFGSKDAVIGDIKSTLQRTGKARLFSNLFDSAYMLEYILMNLGTNSNESVDYPKKADPKGQRGLDIV